MRDASTTDRPFPALGRSVAVAAGAFEEGAASLRHPERVLQFGTGAFLRGFAEFFVERANRTERPVGRIVMVSSTGSGRAARLNEQDGLYTLVVRGREERAVVDEAHIIGAVSRAVASQGAWAEVLAAARHPDLDLIISNTTEVGIQLDEDDRIDRDPPRSFPGKLTAVLYERAQVFDFDPDKGLLILPCELVEDNGDLLRGIVQTLAERWALGPRFRQWLDEANVFCNTLVDRIVPGMPEAAERDALYERLGYTDDLLTVAEPYRLWAIEGNASIRQRLAPLAEQAGVKVADDIRPYRVRKVRILNGGHTISVPTAYLCGCETVREAVEDTLVGAFVQRVILEEIVPSLDLDREMAESFAHDVLERFRNPFIRHELLDITFQQTTKMRVRVMPSLQGFVAKRGKMPASIAFGFACFLLFHHEEYRPADDALPHDDARSYWREQWAGVDLQETAALRRFVSTVSADASRWGLALDQVPGFVDAVTAHLSRAIREGARAALQAHLDDVS